MARYDAAHKQATRHRILETAGRLFKQHGIDGTGIATLMAEAGLTNGAFYAHFRSKDELVAAVIAEELRAQADAFTCLAPGAEGMAALVRSYLSARHRDDRRPVVRPLPFSARSGAVGIRPGMRTPGARAP